MLARDLRTNDAVLKLLQHEASTLKPPWFFELKRGEWKSLEDQTPYNGRKADIEQLGQSFRMLSAPVEAITRKKELFEDEDVYNAVFVKGRGPDAYLFAELLRREFATFWQKGNLANVIAVCGASFDEIVLARFMRAKNQLVSHCVALTGRLFGWHDEWTHGEARRAVEVLLDKNFTSTPWLRHIGIGLTMMLEVIDGITANTPDAEPVNIKKYFERTANQTLELLWKSISTNARLIAGAEWQKQVLQQLVQP